MPRGEERGKAGRGRTKKGKLINGPELADDPKKAKTKVEGSCSIEYKAVSLLKGKKAT